MSMPRCRRSVVFVLASILAAIFLSACSTTDTLEIAAPQAEPSKYAAIVVDATDGSILYSVAADQKRYPASLAKMMTLYLLFEALDSGQVSKSTPIPVSANAARQPASKLYMKAGDTIIVDTAIRALAVKSANDVATAVAEFLAGSEDAFAEQLNATAREIGLTSSHFVNATGWPDDNHYVTARDLATLARRIIVDHPEHYHYYSEKEFTWNDIRQGNRNPLLYKNIGADGLKTGHTEAAGYGLTASAVQNGRRLILVVNGLDSVKARADESERLMSWGFREFNNYALFKAGDTVDEAAVWLGDEDAVPLTIAEDLTVTLPRNDRNGMQVSVVYDSPIPAPIPAGQEIAKLRVSWPGGVPVEVPLQAGKDVEQLGPFGRIAASIKFLLLGSP